MVEELTIGMKIGNNVTLDKHVNSDRSVTNET